MHTPYSEIFGHSPDFEVTYKIFSPEEGGRKTPAYQGIRWDFSYEEYADEGFMIWPEILDGSTSEVLKTGTPIPNYGKATMWILNFQLRSLHQKRIKIGVRGYFMEGRQKVSVCEVIQIAGLFSNSTE